MTRIQLPTAQGLWVSPLPGCASWQSSLGQRWLACNFGSQICAAQPPWALSKNYRAIHHEGPGPCGMSPAMSSGKDVSSFEAVNGAFSSVL